MKVSCLAHYFLAFLFFSCYLTCVGIIEETVLMDYTSTPAEHLDLKNTSSNARVTVITEFLKDILGSDFSIRIENGEDTSGEEK